MACPTTSQVNRSLMPARYNQPSAVGTYVMSVTQVVSADAISPQITELRSPLNTESHCPFTDHLDGGGTDAAKGGRDGDSGLSETRTVSV